MRITLHRSRFIGGFLGLLLGGLTLHTGHAAPPPGGNWPAWRGDGSGVSDATNLPMTWDATNGVAWRTELPGEGSSSPVVWGRRVFVTTSTDGGSNRWVLCLDAHDGHFLWQRPIPAGRIPRTDPKAGYAPATPATDGQRLYVFFDAPGLMAFDMDGTPLWTLPLGPFKSPYNMTSSPLMFRDRVILCCDQSGDGFILAADSATGRLLWKTPRKLNCQYSTPLLVEHRGAWQVVVGASTVKSYDVMTGGEIWTCRGLTGCVAPSPVFGGGLVYATSGRNGPTVGIDPGGTGDVSETHVRLQVPTGGPYVPSPLYCAPWLLLPADDGVVRGVDARGSVQVVARLRAHFTASPVLGGRHLYWTAESGDTFVLDAEGLRASPPALPVVAVNPLVGRCLASPAMAGGRLFIRTTQALYCLAGGARSTPVAARSGLTPAGFAELKSRFERHPAPDGDDIPVRLAVVDAMAPLGDDEAVAFLKEAAIKDPHWDVCEAAAKSLAARDGQAAAGALLDLAGDGRGYMKIITAGGLGRLRVMAAVPVLVKEVAGRDPFVRIASLQALAEIALAPEADVAPILAALGTGLNDTEGSVRLAAVRGLSAVAVRDGLDRAPVAALLQSRVADANPAVADAARRATARLAAGRP